MRVRDFAGAGAALFALTAMTATAQDAVIPETAAPEETAPAAVPEETAPAPAAAPETEVATSEGGAYGAFADVAVADLVGMTVLSGGGEDVGEIESLITATSGDVMAVLGVGGFLGFGEHKVAVTLDELAPAEGAVLLQSLDRESLESMPEYGGDGEAMTMDVTVSGEVIEPEVIETAPPVTPEG